MEDPGVLRADRFGRRYRRGGPWAVRGVSFAVPAGSITALVGPNGAGKSTLIRSCIGFERPDEGRLVVHGADPVRDRVGAVESVGYVPQAATLYRSLTIRDHFTMARAARSRFDDEYAGRRITELGLSLDRVVGELSGGEQSQVALAIALGTRAPLLLLDEPLAALDPLARRDFLTTLLDHVRGGSTTAILSSHIVTDIEHVADRLLVLAQGRLVLDAAIDEVNRQFSIVEGREPSHRHAVGMFVGPRGEALTLLGDPSAGRPANLEEIVLGHLATGRVREMQEVA